MASNNNQYPSLSNYPFLSFLPSQLLTCTAEDIITMSNSGFLDVSWT